MTGEPASRPARLRGCLGACPAGYPWASVSPWTSVHPSEIYCFRGSDGGRLCPEAGGPEMYGDESVSDGKFRFLAGEVSFRPYHHSHYSSSACLTDILGRLSSSKQYAISLRWPSCRL